MGAIMVWGCLGEVFRAFNWLVYLTCYRIFLLSGIGPVPVRLRPTRGMGFALMQVIIGLMRRAYTDY